ncbi:MAG: TolC family protein [Gemmataceae bacterium]
MASGPYRILVGLVLLPGCAVAPRPLPASVSDAAVRNRITAAPEVVHKAEIVVSRADAPAGDIPTFTLTAAVEFALQNNPRLAVAAAAVARAQGQETVAFAPFLPEIDLYTRTGVSSPTLGPGAPGPVGAITAAGDGMHAYTQAEVGLQWTLYDFGRTSGKYNQAVTNQRIADLRLGRARQTVGFDVATAYVRVLLAQATALEQEQTVRRAESILKDTQARREGGVADRDDVLRAEVQLAEFREALVLAREMEYDSVARLNNAMGRNAALPLKVLDWPTRPKFECSLVECLETAASQRLEVRIARDAVAAAQFGLQAADADFYPRIFVMAGVGNVSGDGVRTGWHEGAGLHLNQKLFAGHRRQGEAQVASADVAAAAGTAQSIFDNVSLEVNLAYRRLATTRERIGLTEPAVAQARENLRLVTVKYKNSDATPTDIVDAETTLTRAVQRYNFAVYDYLTALARLEYTMGGPPGGVLEKAQDAPSERPDSLPPPKPIEDQRP